MPPMDPIQHEQFAFEIKKTLHIIILKVIYLFKNYNEELWMQPRGRACLACRGPWGHLSLT